MTLAHAIEPTNTEGFSSQDLALVDAMWLGEAAKAQVENLVCLLRRMKTEKTVSVTDAEGIIEEATEFLHSLWIANEAYIEQRLTA